MHPEGNVGALYVQLDIMLVTCHRQRMTLLII